MAVRLRQFEETDYPALTALYNRCRPEEPQSEASVRAFDQAFGDEYLFNLVVERGESLAGATWAHPDQTGEKQFRLDILTDASAAKDLAGTLYRTALERLEPTARSVVVRVRENWLDWLTFYDERGFREVERMWESRLTLASFEAAGLGDALQRTAAASIEVKTLADLPETQATQRRLYKTVVELLRDVPFAGTLNIWPFEVWQRRFWQHPTRRPKGFFLALDGDKIVGVSELRAGAQPDWLYTGLTGVKRPYRRRGIALALKLSALQHAKEAGFAVVSTQNHVHNRPMLSINEAPGFAKEPAWIKLKKDLSTKP